MATEKPQFKVYLPAETIDAISAYAERHGFKNGKMVEHLWDFFMLRDFNTLADKLRKWTQENPYQPGRSPVGLVQIGAILNNWVNKK